MAEKPRISWIDMAKGYGILFVIWAHLGAGKPTSWMYSFHVPLFFVLSGVTFSVKDKFPKFLGKKSKSLLLPYLCLGAVTLVYYAVDAVIDGTFGAGFAFNLALDFLFQRRFLTLWFITALFLLNIVAYPLIKYVKNKIVLFLIAVSMGALAMVYYELGGGSLYWNVDVVFAAMPFFMVGYVYKENRERIERFLRSKIKILLAFLVCLVINVGTLVACVLINEPILDMYFSRYGCQPLTYLSAFAGSFAIMMLSQLFTWKPMLYLGRNSLLYFAWHFNLVLPIVKKAFAVIGFSESSITAIPITYLYRVALLVAILVICTISNLIIEKTKLRFMIGR